MLRSLFHNYYGVPELTVKNAYLLKKSRLKR